MSLLARRLPLSGRASVGGRLAACHVLRACSLDGGQDVTVEIDGGFVLRLRRGRYALSVGRESPFGPRFGSWFERGELTVAEDSPGGPLALQVPAGSLTVRVADKETGQPRREAHVPVEVPRDGRPAGRAAWLTNVDGEIALAVCPAGSAKIWIGEACSGDPDAAVEVAPGKPPPLRSPSERIRRLQ